MAKQQPSYNGPPAREIGDAFAGMLDGIARFLFWAGNLVTLVSLIILLFQFQASASHAAGYSEAQALANVDLFGKVILAGVAAIFVGSTYMFWGEEILAAIQLIGAAILYFGTPFLASAISGGGTLDKAGDAAIASIQSAGLIFGLLGLVSLIADLSIRARERIRQGAKADQLKYGKGLKEERDIQNVFMGNCWQLPFCRKFVRERCPIYHSRRTCWKEQVGCMCEESVIRNAMEGKVVPKDSVAAAKLIPVNNKLTVAQKFERCKSCVIYNEHQKHKYKLALGFTIVAFVGAYLLMRSFGMSSIRSLILAMDNMVGRVTFGGAGGLGETINQSSVPFHEIVLVCLMLIMFAYALKALEYLIFKAKV